MRVKALLTIPLLTFVLCACDFNVSYEKDFTTGIETMGSGLSCDDVYLSDGNQKISKKSFYYGEKVYLNFDDIKGFAKKENKAFPSMEILVTEQNGDTAIYNPNIYEEMDGTDISPVSLYTHFNTADPIHSEKSYLLRCTIRDTKSKGIFTAKFKFDVKKDNNIDVVSNQISYDEIYLFSQEQNSVITNGKLKLDEYVHIVFEGLEGFNVENGEAHIGMSIKAADLNGNVIIENKDLFEQPVSVVDLKNRLTSSVKFTSLDRSNGLASFTTVVWDKRGESKITTNTILEIYK